MAKLLKLRRGTTSQHGSFTGAEGEVTVDTDKETLVVHDGSTAGGHPVAAEDMANVSSASIAGRLANDSIATSKIAAGALPSDVTVASANIVDGTITNGDVNAGAAIAGTKVSPDFGSQSVVTTGNILLNGDSTGASNHRLTFGSQSGGDLAIYHDGSHSRIKDAGTGNLNIQSNTTAIQNAAGSENCAVFIEDGAVELYHDATKKLETRSGGVTVQGQLSVANTASGGVGLSIPDNSKAAFGTSDDLQIYHDGHSNIVDTGTGNLRIFGNSQIFFGRSIGGEAYATFNSDGAVNLYYDNSIKIATTSGGASVTGNLDVSNGADVTGNLTVSGTVNSGATTVTGNVSVTGEIAATSHIDIPDNAKIKVGTGDDLQIYHNGTNSFISNTTGKIQIDSDDIIQINATDFKIKNAGDTETLGRFIQNGAVKLFYDNSEKFETISAGVSVTGNIAVSGTVDGRDVAADGSKLDNIENNATADQTGAEILALINGSNIYTSTGVFGIGASNNIDFTTDNRMSIHINGSEEFRFESDGDFHADGDVYAFSTTVSSDENLKKDITIVSDAVTKVEALKGVTFKWKKNDADSAGVIAQDVEKVLPEVVKTVNDMEGNEFKAVNYAGLTSILIEAVKDLSARIKVLEAK